MNKLIEIFCDVDYFYYKLLPVWESELIADVTFVAYKLEDILLKVSTPA
jgi:hypothetical protein